MRTLADREQIERELEWLWEFHLRRLKPGAPVDQLFDRAIFSLQPPLNVVECVVCGTVYRNPRELAEEVRETYEQEQPAEPALASLFTQQSEFYTPKVVRLTELAGGTGSVLEVGSYVGAFLRAAEDAGWTAQGLDVNAAASAFARSRGANVIECSLEEYRAGHEFDVVALWNCFDQLADPHAALDAAARLLRAGGLLAIRVPNGAAYAYLTRSRLPMRRALLAWNNLASFPYQHGFTPASLKRLLQEHDYEVVDISMDTLVPISGSWTHPWAAREERILKWVMRRWRTRRLAPWFEVYGRRGRG